MGLLKQYWQQMIVAALAVIAILVAYDQYGPGLFVDDPPEAPTAVGARFVLIDVARIMNAQRRAAGALIEQGASAGELGTLASVGRLVEQTIREVAGPDAVVLVKQGVVVPNDLTPDITDVVLRALNLPTEVPTLDPLSPRYNYGGTNFSESPLPRALDGLLDQRRREATERTQDALQQEQQELVP